MPQQHTSRNRHRQSSAVGVSPFGALQTPPPVSAVTTACSVTALNLSSLATGLAVWGIGIADASVGYVYVNVVGLLLRYMPSL